MIVLLIIYPFVILLLDINIFEVLPITEVDNALFKPVIWLAGKVPVILRATKLDTAPLKSVIWLAGKVPSKFDAVDALPLSDPVKYLATILDEIIVNALLIFEELIVPFIINVFVIAL